MKLKYLAKDAAKLAEKNDEIFNYEESLFILAFENGFKSAFQTINESLTNEINKLEQYPMMGERIFALKLYMKKMDDILMDSESA